MGTIYLIHRPYANCPSNVLYGKKKFFFHRPYANFPSNVFYSKKKKKFLLHTRTRPQSKITHIASSCHSLLFIRLELVLNFSLSFVTLTLWEITG